MVDGKAYEESRRADLDTANRSGVVMKGIEFQGFSEEQQKRDNRFFSQATDQLKDPKSELSHALERIYPGLREQVLVEAAFGKHFVEGRTDDDFAPKSFPDQAPKDPRLSRLWELAAREQELRKKFALPLGRTVIDPKAREALIKEHRQAVAEWGKEALRLSAEGIDPKAYAPPALQDHFRKLSGFTQDTAGISAKNYSAIEASAKVRAGYVEDLADIARVVNPEREVKTRGAPLTRKDPARIELFSPEKPTPPTAGGRFLEDPAKKVSDEYNRIYHLTRGPKLSSDTTTFSDLELREYSRNSINAFQSNVRSLMETADTYYGSRWGPNQFWHPEETRKIDAAISRSLNSVWQDVRTLSQLAENDPRLKPLADALQENLKQVEKIQDRPQELASKYTRDAIANSAAAVVTIGTMGAGSILFGIGQAGKVVTLAELAQAAAVGSAIGGTGNLIDVGARRFIDGDTTARVNAVDLSSSIVFGAGMGVVGRVAPGIGDLAGAYFGYQGTLHSAYAAQEGKWGAATGEFIATVGTLAAIRVSSRLGPAKAEPSGPTVKNPLASADNVLTANRSIPADRSPLLVPLGTSRGITDRSVPDDAPNSSRFTADVAGAQRDLKRPLTPKQMDAIEQAHRVGEGQLGRDGRPAAVGNYTADHLQEKYRILSEAGFPKVGSPNLHAASEDYRGLRGDSSTTSDQVEAAMRAKGHSEDTILRAMEQFDKDAGNIYQLLSKLDPKKLTRAQAEKALGDLVSHPSAKELLETRRWKTEAAVAQKPATELAREMIDAARAAEKNPKLSDGRAPVRDEAGAPLYLVSPKHIEGTQSYNQARSRGEGVGVIPENHVELFRKAVRMSDGNWYAMDDSGTIHRFQEKHGLAHWNGATGGPKNPDPIEIKGSVREFLKMTRSGKTTSPEGPSPLQKLLSKTDGPTRFGAVEQLIREGTGAQLLDGGKKLDIPPETLEVLTQAFIRDYETAAKTPGASPAAQGNLGHMKDHFDFIAAHEESFKAMGIDVRSLRLAVAAHDTGKGFLDPSIAAQIKKLGTGTEKDLPPFLRDYILSHEYHSVARVPEVVRAELKSQGVDIESSAGRAMVEKYSAQIIEAIRLHNGVDVTGDLREKYPSLSDKEIAQVQSAWWPANYSKFAKALGLPETQYGGQTNLIADTLNLIDRATLTSSNAPAKLLAQNLGTMSWDLKLVDLATRLPAEGNIPLIKAQGDRLSAQVSGADQKSAVESLVSAAQKMNENMMGLGETLKGMDDAAVKAGIPREADTVVFRRQDGSWVRINGKNKAEAFVEKWNGKQFVPEAPPAQKTSPVDVLLSELKQAEVWPKGTAAPKTSRTPQSEFKIVADGALENRTYSLVHIPSGKTVQQMKGANLRAGALNPGEIGDYSGAVPPPPARAEMFYDAIQRDFKTQGLEPPKSVRSTYTDSNGRAFEKAFEKYLREGVSRNEAMRRAVLETPSGAATQKVLGLEPYDVQMKPAYDQKGNAVPWAEVEFRAPRAPPLPSTQSERFAVTKKAIEAHLPSASRDTIQKIQEVVETEGHFNHTGVVKHTEATPQQLRARTGDIRKGLIQMGIEPETAKKITSDVIRGGAAGEPQTGITPETINRGDRVSFVDGRSGKTKSGYYGGEFNGQMIFTSLPGNETQKAQEILLVPKGQISGMRPFSEDPVKVEPPPAPLFEFSSKVVGNYTSARGEVIEINPQSRDLQEQMLYALERMRLNGAKPRREVGTPSEAEMRSVSQAWLGQSKSIEQTRPIDGGITPYGDKRLSVVDAGGGRADLGKIVACKAAVCRELSLFGSLALSELGYPTRVGRGNVMGGSGHAWIEFLDPKTGRAIGVLDSNYKERFYSTPGEYFRDALIVPGSQKYTVIAEPASWH